MEKTVMTQDDDPILASLEVVAERAGDISPLVYERFLAADTEAAELMLHTDEHMRGRMFQVVVEFLVSGESAEERDYLAWEIENHRDAYFATVPMYESFFQCFVAVVKETLGESWDEAIESAWQRRTRSVIDLVSELHADPARARGA